jgi:DHA2 family multidrug resistance protein-like MFS transporter
MLRRQAGHAAPMLPVDLFRIPVFALSGITSVCAFTTQGLGFVALPFYFEQMLGLSQIETGFLITPWPIMVAVTANLAGRLTERYPTAILSAGGLVALALGMALLALLPAHPATWDIVWRMGICGAGFGFFQSPNLRMLMASAPLRRAGAASGVIIINRTLGQTLGAALVALCFLLDGRHGGVVALLLGAGFAGAAGIASLARRWVPQGAMAAGE